MTKLSTTEINNLAAIATGSEPSRTATKERAIAKLTSAIAAIAGEDHAVETLQTILACEDLTHAEEALRGAMTPAQKKAKRPPRVGKRAAVLEGCRKGELPAPPDFSANTHKRFRPKLAAVVEAAQAGNLDALRAFEVKPNSSSLKAILKFRDLAIIALEARATNAAN